MLKHIKAQQQPKRRVEKRENCAFFTLCLFIANGAHTSRGPRINSFHFDISDYDKILCCCAVSSHLRLDVSSVCFLSHYTSATFSRHVNSLSSSCWSYQQDETAPKLSSKLKRVCSMSDRPDKLERASFMRKMENFRCFFDFFAVFSLCQGRSSAAARWTRRAQGDDGNSSKNNRVKMCRTSARCGVDAAAVACSSA